MHNQNSTEKLKIPIGGIKIIRIILRITIVISLIAYVFLLSGSSGNLSRVLRLMAYLFVVLLPCCVAYSLCSSLIFYFNNISFQTHTLDKLYKVENDKNTKLDTIIKLLNTNNNVKNVE